MEITKRMKVIVTDALGKKFNGEVVRYRTKLFKFKSKPTVLHRRTCPICDRKLVNIYYSNQLEKYICKRCVDNLLGEKGGAE